MLDYVEKVPFAWYYSFANKPTNQQTNKTKNF